MDAPAARLLYEALTARKNGVLSPIDLDQVNLAGLTIVGGDFVQGRFRRASLAYATLPGARFGKAELDDASFVGSDLAGSDFTSASLRGADLEDAMVEGCVFSGADLRGAKLTNWLGTPLSMAGARLDQSTVDRSELSDEGLRLLFELGARLEPGASLPPSARGAAMLSLPPHVEALSAREISVREILVNQDIEEQPASLRSYLQLEALLARGRTDVAPPSLRPRLPTFGTEQLVGYEEPQVGAEYLGVRLREEIPGASVARSFRGVAGDGVEVVVKVFDPSRYGASLHYPAFRRGLKNLNELQGKGVAELRVVAVDKTAYVVRCYDGGNLNDVVATQLSLDAGLTLFEDLVQIVLRVHASGRLLRSIKPTNVVLDGLAPVITEIDAVDLPTLAQSSGSVGGYAAYAAPEEIVATGTQSPTADVFALGKLLEFILTGIEPLEALGGVSALAMRHDLPEALREIVSRTTRTEPLERYQFLDEVLANLAKVTAKDGATLSPYQSVRPLVPSRLDAKPLGGAARAPARSPATKADKPRARGSRLAEQKGRAGASAFGAWLSRRAEVTAALVAALVSVVLLTGIVLTPAAYDELASRVFYAALPLGLLSWLLPRSNSNLALFRVTIGLGLGYLIGVFLPDPLARAAYQRALRQSDPLGKQFALVQLTRAGERAFIGADLQGTRYFKEDLVSVDFGRANLSEADFSGSMLLEANFAEANLSHAVFKGADLRQARFEGARSLETSVCDQWTMLSSPFACRGGHIANDD